MKREVKEQTKRACLFLIQRVVYDDMNSTRLLLIDPRPGKPEFFGSLSIDKCSIRHADFCVAFLFFMEVSMK